MAESVKKLSVFWGEHLVGHLWLDPRRRFIFQYDSSWLKRANVVPISLSLPLKEEEYGDDLSRPFFANLLPEADVRKALSKNFGISETNDFALLEAVGGECAGAISLWPEGSSPTKRGGGEYRPLPPEELERLIAGLPKPMLLAKKGLRLSLAGAQHKLPVFVRGEELFLPEGTLSSSHILKPQIQHFDHTVENEAFCMMLASRTGLPTPEVKLLPLKTAVYLIERYDRETNEKGECTRVHQEDFCQALGFLPDQKYESEGGPGIRACFSLVSNSSSQPLKDKLFLIQWVIFNYLIGNSDAHAKNISILFAETGVKLSPFYDLMSTAVYDELTKKMAMKIGGERRPDFVQKRHWERFAEETESKPKVILDLCEELAKSLPKLANDLQKEFTANEAAERIVRKICNVIEARSKKLLSVLKGD